MWDQRYTPPPPPGSRCGVVMYRGQVSVLNGHDLPIRRMSDVSCSCHSVMVSLHWLTSWADTSQVLSPGSCAVPPFTLEEPGAVLFP